MIDWLKGKKTYLLAFAAVVYAVSGWYLGKFDTQAMIDMLWAALTAGALRAGITNK